MKKQPILLLSIIGIISLISCSNGGPLTDGINQPAANTTIPVVTQNSAGKVRAEAVVEPARWVELRAETGGIIHDVWVEEGEYVEAGKLLVQLDPTDTELAVQKAKAGLATAQAQLDTAKAGTRPEQIAILEAQLETANAALSQAVAARDQQAYSSTQADIDEAQAGAMEAELAHKDANETHDDTLDCFDVTLPDGSEKTICPTLGTYEELTRAQEQIAYAALLAAYAQVEALKNTAEPKLSAVQAAVQAAVAQRDAVQAQLDRAKAGSREEELAVAEAGVKQAETALAQAQAMLDLITLEAPFDGTIVELPLKAGDTAATGTPLITIATLEQLEIKTKDLNELDVVQIEIGQPALVTLDARLVQPLMGHVVKVAKQSTDYLGDVTYSVYIKLDDAPPEWLYWGMTAQVEIATQSTTVEADPTTTTNPANAVIAEANLEPERWSSLSFVNGGKVATIAVETGDTVKAGDVLIQLENTYAALAVQEAEAAVATAKAQLALKQAGPHPDEVAASEAQVEAAKGDLWQAAALRDQLKGGTGEAELAAAQVEYEQAKAELEAMQRQWGTPDDEDEQKQLNALTLKFNAAQARLEALPDINEARLREANSGVWAAQAQRDVVQAQLELLKAGATAEEIAIAEAEVKQAEAALAEAQANLERTAITATFDGTVTEIYIEVGDMVSPGQPVLVLATLERLQARTIDLTELDVVHLYAGQPVSVQIDALAEQTLPGTIKQIKLRSVDYRGDVTYPVIITLDDVPEAVRWGMTAMVEVSEP